MAKEKDGSEGLGNSDLFAKQMCIEWLKTQGFNNVVIAPRKEDCDLMAKKEEKEYFIEIKSSNKKKGKDFFGSVGFNQLQKSIENESNYLFLFCRCEDESSKDKMSSWFFKSLFLGEFLSFVKLVHLELHYRIHLTEDGEFFTPKVKKDTVVVSRKLIKDMVRFYEELKKEYVFK